MFILLFGFMTFLSVVTGLWPTAIIFGILTILWIAYVSDERAHYRARRNRDRYWAYGEEPGWKRRKRIERERQIAKEKKLAEQRRAERAAEQRTVRSLPPAPARIDYSLPIAPVVMQMEQARQRAVPIKPVAPKDYGERLFVCHTCGHEIRTAGIRKETWDGRIGTEFFCPRCKTNQITYI